MDPNKSPYNQELINALILIAVLVIVAVGLLPFYLNRATP